MGIFSNLFRPTRPSRPRTAKPTLETLGERIVPAINTNSTSIHSVTDNNGTTVVFYEQNNSLFANGNGYSAGGKAVWGRGGVQGFSAGVGANGYADCFFKVNNGTFWEATRTPSGSWGLTGIVNANGLSPAVSILAGGFSADGHGNVFFVNASASGGPLWEWSGSTNTFTRIDASNTVAVDAVSLPSVGSVANPTDVVFALRPKGVLGYYFGVNTSFLGFVQISGPDPILPGFSAGLDQNGLWDVYAFDTSHALWKWDAGVGYWQSVAGPNAVQAFSATSYGQVDAIAANGTLVQYDQNNHPTCFLSLGTEVEISVPLVTGAAAWLEDHGRMGNYLYTVTPASSSGPRELWEGQDFGGAGWLPIIGPVQ